MYFNGLLDMFTIYALRNGLIPTAYKQIKY